MRILTVGKIFGAFLLFAFAGCGREQAPSPALPAVIAVSPANAATGVVLNTAVTAGFGSVMAPATINTATFTLTGPAGAAVAGAVTYAGTTATFTPTNALAANTMYAATITTGAQDPSGAALAVNFLWSFTTGTIPTVVSTNPLNGAVKVPMNQKITAPFSEAMNATTVTAGGDVHSVSGWNRRSSGGGGSDVLGYDGDINSNERARGEHEIMRPPLRPAPKTQAARPWRVIFPGTSRPKRFRR